MYRTLITSFIGTTSACAENTCPPILNLRVGGNYLRVRGEYSQGPALRTLHRELPPRARRIHDVPAIPLGPRGTTSACAENTGVRVDLVDHSRNYLRVRGEYRHCYLLAYLCPELPPRARRIQTLQKISFVYQGTTSACAENTLFLILPFLLIRNYLRVRGEYKRKRFSREHDWELPPRARRIPLGDRKRNVPIGTTSACAENTSKSLAVAHMVWNYLRVRGEYNPKTNPR